MRASGAANEGLRRGDRERKKNRKFVDNSGEIPLHETFHSSKGTKRKCEHVTERKVKPRAEQQVAAKINRPKPSIPIISEPAEPGNPSEPGPGVGFFPPSHFSYAPKVPEHAASSGGNHDRIPLQGISPHANIVHDPAARAETHRKSKDSNLAVVRQADTLQVPACLNHRSCGNATQTTGDGSTPTGGLPADQAQAQVGESASSSTNFAGNNNPTNSDQPAKKRDKRAKFAADVYKAFDNYAQAHERVALSGISSEDVEALWDKVLQAQREALSNSAGMIYLEGLDEFGRKTLVTDQLRRAFHKKATLESNNENSEPAAEGSALRSKSKKAKANTSIEGR